MEAVGNCPICGTTLPKEPGYLVREWKIAICPECGAGVTTPRPTIDEIGAYYKDSFFSVRPDDDVAAIVRDILSRRSSLGIIYLRTRRVVLDAVKNGYERCLMGGIVKRTLLAPVRFLLGLLFDPVIVLAPQEPGKLLDVGFGRGELMMRARRLGWDVHGVEVSQKSVDWGTEMGLSVQRFDGAFREPLPYPNGTFDAVTMLNVLEHTHDPRKAIERTLAVLKPGGRLIVAVPNFDAVDIPVLGPSWNQWQLPQHLTFFTGPNLTRLLKECGMEVADVIYKKWLNPMTEIRGLQNAKAASKERGDYSRGRQIRLAFFIRVGKRVQYLMGRRPAAQIANGMCVYARRPK